MGYLRRGKWVNEWYDTASTGGSFVREDARFRSRVSAGGEFSPEPGRYHLYVSWACPWAHRTLIYRALKGLEEAIGVTVVDPLMLSDGWVIPRAADPVDAQFLWQIYAKADPGYVGRATVPVLWDRQRETIVNNESGDIIRMFDTWPGADGPVFRPAERASEIDALNEEIYRCVNNGVYRAGFATTQAAYEEAFCQLFAMLDRLEHRLRGQPFLLGEQVTETDWRLFTTLVRFDAVYYGHFKCNRDRLVDFPEL
jgi:glutathionyl-hydroquinone reductase